MRNREQEGVDFVVKVHALIVTKEGWGDRETRIPLVIRRIC